MAASVLPAVGENRFPRGTPVKQLQHVGPVLPLIFPEQPDRPRMILMGLSGDSRLRLRRPIPVSISADGETVTAYVNDVEEFGYGPNLSAALEDLSKTLAQLLFSLAENEQRLGPGLAQTLKVLRDYFELRRGA